MFVPYKLKKKVEKIGLSLSNWTTHLKSNPLEDFGKVCHREIVNFQMHLYLVIFWQCLSRRELIFYLEVPIFFYLESAHMLSKMLLLL